MTDRELLERAAKAAGIVGDWEAQPDYAGVSTSGIYIEGRAMLWNPLTDDGDALWLLVTLDMEIHGGRKPVNFREVIFMLGGDPHSEEIAPYEPDQMAATRRAIVRAAAAMVQP